MELVYLAYRFIYNYLYAIYFLIILNFCSFLKPTSIYCLGDVEIG